MKDKNMTAKQFGEIVGASKYAVGKWARGERMPRDNSMAQIVEATGGAVRPEDFYNTPSAKAA